MLANAVKIDNYAASNDDAANMPTVIPPTPQAAQFIRYGEIPVGHTTGVPKIDIPIYTLSTGWIDIPISISYHASGFRPREIASPVGLGWVLNAGGCISRSVDVTPDYKYRDTMFVKSESEVNAMKTGNLRPYNINFSKYGSHIFWTQFLFDVNADNKPDIRSDRYVYNFLGHNGVARYDVNTKKLNPVPYNTLKIDRISEDNFVITDTKGIKYEFTQTEATTSSFTATTAWYITKITYPGMENDPIVFRYIYSQIYYNNIYSQTVEFQTANQYGGDPITKITSFPYKMYSYHSPLIDKIMWRNVSIQFNYTSDRQDKRKERLNTIVVKSGNETVKQAILGNNQYFGNKKENYRLKLADIFLTGSDSNGNGEKYSFSYNSSSLPDYLDAYCQEDFWGYYNGTKSGRFIHKYIAEWWNAHNNNNHTGDAMTFTHFDYTDRNPSEGNTKICQLTEITYPTKGKTIFEYEINRSNPYQFFNGNIDNVGGLRLKRRINLSPDGAVLGWKEYEYTGSATMNITMEMFNGRVDNIGYKYDSEGLPTTTSRVFPSTIFHGSPMYPLTGWSISPVFYYSVTEYYEEKTIINGEWVHSGKTVYNYRQDNGQGVNNACYNDDTYWSPVYGFSIYADCDKGFLQGYPIKTTVYDRNDMIIKEEQKEYMSFSIPNIHYGVHIGMGIRLLCDFQSFINPCSNVGTAPSIIPFSTTDPEYCKQELFEEYFLNRIIARNSYALQDIFLPSATIATEYVNGQLAVSKTTSYSYDVKDGKPITFTPSKVTVTGSRGESYTNTTFFPYSDNYKSVAPYNTMLSKNMLEYPVEGKSEKGTAFIRQVFTKYKSVTGTSIILPDVISVKYRSNEAAESRITYHNYDSRGNPVYLSRDGSEKVVYLWGYNYQYPIAEIKNATYDQIKNILTQTLIDRVAGANTPSVADVNAINNLRFNATISNAQITTYTYKPLVGMTSITDPRGVVTTYEYDAFGRLQSIKDENGSLIENYEYHYK
jgi:YD repeat-containing protein